MSDYENKSKEDLIKAISGPKPKLGIKKNKLKEVKKGFYNLRKKSSKKEVDEYRKVFYDIKNYRYLSKPEIEETRKFLMNYKKCLKSLKMILIVFIN